jgi:hypothetical protein
MADIYKHAHLGGNLKNENRIIKGNAFIYYTVYYREADVAALPAEER